ncbi:MAG: hypothetical protein N2747_02155 [Chitinophagaceae bacterium]|nr:hypothetical protein [Chitinophagaceae bacterium]
MKRFVLFLLFTAPVTVSVFSQKIVYSEYDRDDSRRMNFEIVGKVSGLFMIYKNTRNRHWIVTYDNDMRQVSKTEQNYLPRNERLTGIDFFPYSDHVYAIYQYQKKNVVYCMMARIDGNGKIKEAPVEIDTSFIGSSGTSRIYTALASEDKNKICVFKINSRNKRMYVMTTFLFDQQMKLIKRSRLNIPMDDRNDHLGDFSLDNDGHLVFTRFTRNSNENITQASMLVKWAMADTLTERKLSLEKNMLDEIHVKVDNANRRYLLLSFYYKEKRGNIDGLYFYIWDKDSARLLLEKTYAFDDEIRREAKGDASLKMAFNDYFIRQIIIRRDGGFILSAEAFYTTSRFNNWNRWNFLYGNPFFPPFWDGFYYSPFFTNAFWFNRFSNTQSVRFHADNIAVFSFNKQAEPEWKTVLSKSQFHDDSDDLISFQLMNTGDQLHFLFNLYERRNNLLTDYSVSPSGELTRNPTLKNLDRGYEFMPKYAKQVSARQMIIPCLYRGYICFAKIDYGTN